MSTPLGGVDVFHLVHDRVLRRRGLAGNHCTFVVELDGRIDRDRLERRLSAARDMVPELRWQLSLRPAGPVWREGKSATLPFRVIAAGDDADVRARVAASIDDRTDGDTPWAVDLVAGRARNVVLLRWFHPYTDAKGAERLATWLGAGEGDAPPPPAPAEERFDPGRRPLAKLDRKARIEAARVYGNHMLALARKPIVSLASLAKGKLGRSIVERAWLSEAETASFDRRVREKAKLAETSVMVFASASLLDSVLRGRGLAPVQYLIPVPLSLDPKVGSGRMFGNNLTMMTFALGRDDLADLGRAVQSLAEQQRAIVKEKLDVGMLASLDLFRPVPSVFYHWFMTRPFGGEMSSLVFSNPGKTTLTTFAGVPVKEAYPLPGVTVPPGFQVIFTRSAGRLSAWIVFADGVLSEEERRGLAGKLTALLVG